MNGRDKGHESNQDESQPNKEERKTLGERAKD